jgi:hypothetical protein
VAARGKARAVTEKAHSNDDNGGRYKYQKVLVHSTNRDHLVPSALSPTNVPPLRVADRYAGARVGDDDRHGEAG